MSEITVTNTRLREIWRTMKKRCHNPKNRDYAHYGAHGIRVCKEWQDFDAFKEWALAHGYDNTKTLDRMNNNVGYSPTNCRWISRRRRKSCLRKNQNQSLTHMCQMSRRGRSGGSDDHFLTPRSF